MDYWPPTEGSEDDSRYRRLWFSVIYRIKQDAEGQDLMADSPEFEVPILMRQAREFLTSDSIDLQLLYEFAGLSYEEQGPTYWRGIYGMRQQRRERGKVGGKDSPRRG